MLFEVAVISKPSKNDADKGVTEILVLPPTAIVAKDKQTAIAKVSATNKIENLDACEVLVRAFPTT